MLNAQPLITWNRVSRSFTHALGELKKTALSAYPILRIPMRLHTLFGNSMNTYKTNVLQHVRLYKDVQEKGVAKPWHSR